jgi:hypothetical protein
VGPELEPGTLRDNSILLTDHSDVSPRYRSVLRRFWSSRHARPWVVVLVAALLGFGCTGSLVVDDGPPIVTLTGQADGALINGAECAWITEDSGRRLDVGYPVGWTWKVAPFRAIDNHGRTRISAGDRVTVKGVLPEVGESICNLGELFDIRQVVAP